MEAYKNILVTFFRLHEPLSRIFHVDFEYDINNVIWHHFGCQNSILKLCRKFIATVWSNLKICLIPFRVGILGASVAVSPVSMSKLTANSFPLNDFKPLNTRRASLLILIEFLPETVLERLHSVTSNFSIFQPWTHWKILVKKVQEKVHRKLQIKNVHKKQFTKVHKKSSQKSRKKFTKKYTKKFTKKFINKP